MDLVVRFTTRSIGCSCGIDLPAFETGFTAWAGTLATPGTPEVVAIDGKTVRRSFDHGREQSPLHLVSARVSSFKGSGPENPLANQALRGLGLKEAGYPVEPLIDQPQAMEPPRFDCLAHRDRARLLLWRDHYEVV